MPRLIDANALKKLIAKHVYPVADAFNSRDYGMFWTGGIEKAIDDAPTVDAEPVRHGHWVHGKELSRDYIGDVCVSIHYDKCWCSECDYPIEGHPLWMYCPNCGARMDGERREDGNNDRN